ncbi:MAG: LamG domain-containing protein [Bacteroidetes bacterium]|nr:LamG domain-containing protein [Bacteroidota bacterium]
MKTIKPTLLAAAVLLATTLNSCRKDANPTPVSGFQRDSLSMGALDLRHFKCKDPKKTLSEGLLAWYPFSGNADDWSGNGYNGVLTGATLTVGKYGCNNSAYSFNGNAQDYITLPLSYGDTTQFSLYARVKRGSNGTILSIGDLYRNDQTELDVSFDSTSVAAGLSWQRIFKGPPPRGYVLLMGGVGGRLTLARQDCWEDIAVTFNKSVLVIYINGKMVSSAAVTLSPALFGPWYVGINFALYRPYSGFLTGVIDEMRFYNRPLTLEEIGYLYKH